MSKNTDLDPRIVGLCQRLKQIRIDKGYPSYEAFAFDKCLGRMSVWRVEKGCNLTLNTLFTYLDIFDMTLEEFILYEHQNNVSLNKNNEL